MKQNDVYRSVARVTGESVQRLRRMGFSLVLRPEVLSLPQVMTSPGGQPRITSGRNPTNR